MPPPKIARPKAKAMRTSSKTRRTLATDPAHHRYKLTSVNQATGKAEKFVCPGCGKRGRFRRYWDLWRNDWSSDTAAGVCDRDNSCRYSKFPDRDAEQRPRTMEQHAPQRAETPQIPLNSMYEARQHHEGANTLKTWFYSLFSKSIVDDVWKEYGATAAPGDWVAFWQFDSKGMATTAREIKYKPDGHRWKIDENGKEIKPKWAHNYIQDKPAGYQPRKHLFGLRNAMSSTAPKVAVMESEKSALLCECARRQFGFMQDYTFVATGGATYINGTMEADREHLAGRAVYLFPDSDEPGRKWIEDAAKYGAGVCDNAHQYAAAHGISGDGFDIGDLVAVVAEQRKAARRTETTKFEANGGEANQEAAPMANATTAAKFSVSTENYGAARATASPTPAARIPERCGTNPPELAKFLVSIGYAPDWRPPANAERGTQLFPF